MSLFEAGFNLPPGVTGNEPQLTGEWPCRECGATLPEEADCPECDKAMELVDVRGGREWHCRTCDVFRASDVCPDGCPEDPRGDYDAHMDMLMERGGECW